MKSFIELELIELVNEAYNFLLILETDTRSIRGLRLCVCKRDCGRVVNDLLGAYLREVRRWQHALRRVSRGSCCTLLHLAELRARRHARAAAAAAAEAV